jgi:UDP-N-acetylmuramate dehydrogenase
MGALVARARISSGRASAKLAGMSPPVAIADGVMLAPLTTLGLGGPARHLVEARDEETVVAAVRWAAERGLPLCVLGGGSNVLFGDGGFDGLVLRIATRGLRFQPDGAEVLVHAAAGEPWDPLVSEAVARDLGGIECLAGIPGLVGATPIQNVGAYGQEVAATIRAVRALDRATGEVVVMSADDCEFEYRDSRFKRHSDRHVVLEVTFALDPGAAPEVRYRELGDALAARAGAGAGAADLGVVAATVRALRRRKSMLLDDASDPNRRSAGSFFLNPVMSTAEAEAVAARAVESGAARSPAEIPRFPAGTDRVKLSAAWLVEGAGFPKGSRRGAVGVSSRHALALVHHGGGRSADLLALARDIRAAVAARFGVTLVPEPVLVGTGPL